MLHTLATVLWLAFLLLGVQARSSTGDSILVVLEPQLQKSEFSEFFGGLEKRGYKLTFRAPLDAEPAIFKDDEPTFDHLVLLAPTSKKYADDITPQNLVSYLTFGKNVIFTLSPTSTPLSSLAAEFSLILPPPQTPLVSHFPERDGPRTTIPIPIVSKSPVLSDGLKPVHFEGIGFALGTSPLLVPLLRAPPESFCADSDAGTDALVDAAEKGGEGLWAGSSLAVVAGFQPKSQGAGRALWVGGPSTFIDKFAKHKGSGNRQFVQDISAWAFQESLVLRIDDVRHHRLNETEAPQSYTINDQIVYTAQISRWDSNKDSWSPYSMLTDLQLEFTMLDPFVRTALRPLAGSPGTYQTTFKAPDRHGVFKFVIDYKRKGWTFLRSEKVVPVVPPRHDGYPRFVSAAWPYYAGAISTSIGFIIFSALWLGGDHRDARIKKTE